MTEFAAEVWRRRVSSIPLIGQSIEKKNVSVEAFDVHSALDQVLRAERLEHPASRFCVYVQIETDLGVHGVGDIELVDHIFGSASSTTER